MRVTLASVFHWRRAIAQGFVEASLTPNRSGGSHGALLGLAAEQPHPTATRALNLGVAAPRLSFQAPRLGSQAPRRVVCMAANSKMDSTSDRLVGRMFAIAMIACSAATTVGCTDGPLFQLKKLSPWHQREWRKDRELGPTYSQRIGELELLESRIASMPDAEQEKWAGILEKIVTSDTSPEMRARAAGVLALTDTEAATRALNAASTDEVEKVRLAVCRAWGTRRGDQARDMLMSLAQTDESADVRQAALASLGHFDSKEVRELLAESLDNKSPAIQQQAVVSLRTLTGRDYGGDFDAWKRYIGGENVAEPEAPSMTARLMQSLPWTR